MILKLLRSTLFPYTTLFRSEIDHDGAPPRLRVALRDGNVALDAATGVVHEDVYPAELAGHHLGEALQLSPVDRKSTRLNSSHSQISYAVFCLKKKIHQSRQL